MAFESVPIDTEIGIVLALARLKHLPGLFFGKMGAYFLHVLDVPDNGDLVSLGENTLDIDRVCFSGFATGFKGGVQCRFDGPDADGVKVEIVRLSGFKSGYQQVFAGDSGR